MAVTHAHLLRTSERLGERYGEDSSEIVARLSEEWTIRKFKTYADAYREGVLMSNCFAPKVCDEAVRDEWIYHPETVWFRCEDDGSKVFLDRTKTEAEILASGESFAAHFYRADLESVEDFDLSHTWGGNCLSLRDPDNIPHLSYCEDRMEILGRKNSVAKKKHIARWNEYKPIDYIEAPPV